MPSGYNILDPTLGLQAEQRELLEASNQQQALDGMRGQRYVDRQHVNYTPDQHIVGAAKWTMLNPTLTLVVPAQEVVTRSIIMVNFYLEVDMWNTAGATGGADLVLYDSLEAPGTTDTSVMPAFYVGNLSYRGTTAPTPTPRVDGWEAFAYFARPGTHVIRLGTGAYHGNDNMRFEFIALEGNIL